MNIMNCQMFNKISSIKASGLSILKLKDQHYDGWPKEEELDDEEEEDDVPPLEGDEKEMKEGKGLKTLSPNKVLNSLPIFISTYKSYKKFKQTKK